MLSSDLRIVQNKLLLRQGIYKEEVNTYIKNNDAVPYIMA